MAAAVVLLIAFRKVIRHPKRGRSRARFQRHSSRFAKVKVAGRLMMRMAARALHGHHRSSLLLAADCFAVNCKQN
jgi:hypothetical protein